MTENFQNLGRKMNTQIGDAQRKPNTLNIKRYLLRHIIIKLSSQNRHRILKTEKAKQLWHYPPPPPPPPLPAIKLSADFQQKSCWPGESQTIYSKCWKKRKLPTKNIIPSKALLQKWRRDQEFQRQTKAEGVHHH